MATINTIASKPSTKSKSSRARADRNPHPYFVAWRAQNARAAEAFEWLGEKDRQFILAMMEDIVAEIKEENAQTKREWELHAIQKKSIEPRA